ncbi:MAG: NAD(+)/NADH kinase [Candidatus Latescibacterota bacterium]|nr:NAD(+)/NADH kinase [Candidatus Latescibacterota bacterium]
MIELNKVGALLRDEEQPFPVEEVAEYFQGRGVEFEVLEWDHAPRPDLDLVLAMGGDGTVLKALALCPNSPVLAINYGAVGFLTAGDRAELRRLLDLLGESEYLLSERLALECEHPGGSVRAVNEVIVRSAGGFVSTDVFVDDTKIRTITGDGVVVGTPTGSTGFLLSTGAPIVMPDVRCFVLDGINEYNFTSRSLILTPESRIRLHVSLETKDPNVLLTVDGQKLAELNPGDDVQITQSLTTAKLIYFDSTYFFHNLSSKLSW